MQRLKNKLILSSALLIVFFNYQCTGIRKSTKSDLTYNSFYDVYVKSTNFSEYNFLQAKYIVKINSDNKNKTFSGSIKYISDSVLFLNMVSRSLGVEVFRANCTPDSLYFIDRINRRYYEGNYSYLKQYAGINVNFKILRAIFLGKIDGLAFSYDSTKFNYFEKSRDQNSFNFSYSMSNMDQEQLTKISTPYISHSFSISNQGYIGKSEYDDMNSGKFLNINYMKHLGSTVPIEFAVTTKINNSITNLNFTYSSVLFDPFDIRYKVPNSYTLMK